METLRIISFFCEDIRDEVSTQQSLIGILPDNINFQLPPEGGPEGARPVIPKLGIYTRAVFSPNDNLGPIFINLVMPDQGVIELGSVGADVIAKAKSDAVAKGNPLAGVRHTALLQGFSPPIGVVMVQAVVGATKFETGFLNITQPPA